MADDDERTYSIWPFAVGFVLLLLVGAAGLLLIPSPGEPTATIPAFTTTTAAPGATTEATDDGDAAGTDAAGTDGSTDGSSDGDGSVPAPTVPGGAAAPAGVRDVVAADGSVSYAFDTPEDLATAPLRAAIGRATAVPDQTGAGIVVTVSCATGVDVALAQVTVTESPTSVSVLPVVISAASAPECPAGATDRQVALPLQSPVGDRSIVLAPAGTTVPVPAPG